ncbi:Homoserine dehydrogenase [Mycoemilia scoparia]|uniref:Homoserine dehydrogenase n=1 Tax=Mycoemilia scoparia TaxID=417184 RepID=A0A9W8DVP8_9FUNG|nr:Homoserine dehydrogenase [Mycoemilia scoparia]
MSSSSGVIRQLKVAIVGPGLVGAALVEQLIAYRSSPRYELLPIKLAGVINTKGMLLENEVSKANSLSELQEALSKAPSSSLDDFVDAFAADSKYHSVVVDCTSSDGVASKYPSWLKKGLSVVTPNKKGFSGSQALFNEIQELSKGPGEPLVYHEATVGAGLPVLSTLNDLIKTGDKIKKIEGIFSGTLSYLFNTFSHPSAPKQKFSEIVKVAKANGFTEPDPRDDLNGMDVARKATILGRVSGLPLSIDTLPVENIVPKELQGVQTAEEFLSKLPDFDGEFDKLNQEALDNNQVLRYVAVINFDGESSVKLMKYPLSHPFASLQGSDNIIAFTTERFPNPLIIQGAGAGAAVTAFGIFGDIIKIAERTWAGKL